MGDFVPGGGSGVAAEKKAVAADGFSTSSRYSATVASGGNFRASVRQRLLEIALSETQCPGAETSRGTGSGAGYELL